MSVSLLKERVFSYTFIFENTHTLDSFNADYLDQPQELLAHTQRFTKLEVQQNAEHPKYFIHLNPVIMTKELRQNLDMGDFYDMVKEAVEGPYNQRPGKKLDAQKWNTLADGFDKINQELSAEKICLFCRNGHFDTAAPEDHVMDEKGVITPIKAILGL